mgnify:FL=1
MTFWVGLFLVIVVLGALAGGQSFGDTVSKGIGCLLALIIGIVLLIAISAA